MNVNILSTSGKAFQKFIRHLTEKLPKPKTKFITDLLCGMLFSSDLILTNIASKVPHQSRLAAIAKRFRRQLADSQSFLKVLLLNYLCLARRRLDLESLFIVDLTDIAKPYAKKMENIATVRDGDKDCLVIILRDLVEHLSAQSRSWLVYKEVYFPDIGKPLYVVAYQRKGYEQPIILLTDMMAANRDLALGVRNRYAKRWAGCETSVQFLKSKIGLERFAVRKYRSMQGLIFLAFLAMGFLSFLQSRCKDIRQRIEDKLRYCREPKSFWFYRLVIALRDSLSNRAKMSLSAWCRPP